MASPTQHQAFQPFPKLDTPMVDSATGAPSIPWYRLFIALWKKTGGQLPVTQSVVIKQAPAGGVPLEAYDASTGAFLGQITTTVTPGPPVVVSLGASPATYVAPANGTLFVSSGQVSISRDSGATYYPVSLTGGPVPMAKGDLAQIEWFSTAAPTAVFLPGVFS